MIWQKDVPFNLREANTPPTRPRCHWAQSKTVYGCQRGHGGGERLPLFLMSWCDICRLALGNKKGKRTGLQVKKVDHISTRHVFTGWCHFWRQESSSRRRFLLMQIYASKHHVASSASMEAYIGAFWFYLAFLCIVLHQRDEKNQTVLKDAEGKRQKCHKEERQFSYRCWNLQWRDHQGVLMEAGFHCSDPPHLPEWWCVYWHLHVPPHICFYSCVSPTSPYTFFHDGSFTAVWITLAPVHTFNIARLSKALLLHPLLLWNS